MKKKLEKLMQVKTNEKPIIYTEKQLKAELNQLREILIQHKLYTDDQLLDAMGKDYLHSLITGYNFSFEPERMSLWDIVNDQEKDTEDFVKKIRLSIIDQLEGWINGGNSISQNLAKEALLSFRIYNDLSEESNSNPNSFKKLHKAFIQASDLLKEELEEKLVVYQNSLPPYNIYENWDLECKIKLYRKITKKSNAFEDLIKLLKKHWEEHNKLYTKISFFNYNDGWEGWEKKSIKDLQGYLKLVNEYRTFTQDPSAHDSLEKTINKYLSEKSKKENNSFS